MKLFGNKNGFSLWQLLIVVAILCLLAAFVLPGFTPAARAAGAEDVYRSATSTNISITITNSGSITATITTGVFYNVSNSQRVRLIVQSDPATPAFIGLGTNDYLSGTTGYPLYKGTNYWTSARPGLWKSGITLNLSQSLSASTAVTTVHKIIDETGSY